MAIVNKYPGLCGSCRTDVLPGKGFAHKIGGRWTTVCTSTACAEALGIPREAMVPVTDRKLRADGSIVVPYDHSILPVLRSFPGARWNAERSCWTVSTAVQNRPRVLELAQRLGLEIAPELLSYEKPQATLDAIARAKAIPTIRPYQIEGVEWLSLRQKSILGDDQGLGKTLQVLLSIPTGGRCVVVCPASVKGVWQAETAKWRTDLRVTVLSGRGSFRAPLPGEVVVVNYDILPGELKQRDTGKKTRKGNPIKVKYVDLPDFGDLSDATIAVDEAHNVRKYKTDRSVRLAALVRLFGRAVYMTGTPLLKCPLDLWGILTNGDMASEVFGSWNTFLRVFGGGKGQWGGYQFSGPVNEEAANRLRRVMLRREKSEVAKDLPPKQYQDVVVSGEIAGTVRERIDRAYAYWHELGLEIDENGDIVRAPIPSFREMAEARALLAQSKIPALLEMVEGFEASEEPLIVFSAHLAPIEALAKREGWAVIHGGVANETRTEIVAKFQRGELKGIGITIKAGGTGLTLTRASNEIFVDLEWNPADNTQAEDRAHRIGQEAESVNIIRLVADHPLDARIFELLTKKEELFRATMNQGEVAPIELAPTPQLVEETREELEQRLDTAARQTAEDCNSRHRFYLENKRIHKARVARGKIARKHEALGLKYKSYSEEERETIKSAHSYMIARCDGALKQDGVGFNKPDASIMHWMAVTEYDTDEAYAVAEEILRHYPGQLADGFPSLFGREGKNVAHG